MKFKSFRTLICFCLDGSEGMRGFLSPHVRGKCALRARVGLLEDRASKYAMIQYFKGLQLIFENSADCSLTASACSYNNGR